MSFSTTTAVTVVFQQLHRNIKSRRLLLHTPLNEQQVAATPPLSGNMYGASELYPRDSSFEARVAMIVSILFCALICSVVLNAIYRCAFRCSTLPNSESSESSLAQTSNSGINKKALKTFPIVNYSADMKLPGLDSECVVCLSEFAPGERVKVLPKCNHGFHIKCIDRWLKSHSSCPTCRHCLIQTCEKIVSCSMPNTLLQTAPHQQVINVRIAPLGPEGVINGVK
ncbi:RING-H2 finger protein ATL78-like isoform X1 [Apium graveolens]|uniref:RING-H2 finger protein ATL78-like isoform X1 n=2 Tax=Apium graveolens TaxID=4045 RepID=UPI003D7A1E10